MPDPARVAGRDEILHVGNDLRTDGAGSAAGRGHLRGGGLDVALRARGRHHDAVLELALPRVAAAEQAEHEAPAQALRERAGDPDAEDTLTQARQPVPGGPQPGAVLAPAGRPGPIHACGLRHYSPFNTERKIAVRSQR